MAIHDQRFRNGIAGFLAGWPGLWFHHQVRRTPERPLPQFSLVIETIAVLVVGLTGHLGGFLSGVTGRAREPMGSSLRSHPIAQIPTKPKFASARCMPVTEKCDSNHSARRVRGLKYVCAASSPIRVPADSDHAAVRAAPGVFPSRHGDERG